MVGSLSLGDTTEQDVGSYHVDVYAASSQYLDGHTTLHVLSLDLVITTETSCLNPEFYTTYDAATNGQYYDWVFGESTAAVYVYLPSYTAVEYSSDGSTGEDCGTADLRFAYFEHENSQIEIGDLDSTSVYVDPNSGELVFFPTASTQFASGYYNVYAMLSYNGLDMYPVYVASIIVTELTDPTDPCEGATITVGDIYSGNQGIQFIINESDEIYADWPYYSDSVTDSDTTSSEPSCGSFTVTAHVYRAGETVPLSD